jgi:hypothetical protein
MNGIDFKEAIKQAKVLAGIEDEFMTADQRRRQEARMRAAAEERGKYRKWRDELRSNLILYTSLEWELHRKAKRQCLETWTEELEEQSELAAQEAIRKEIALDTLESMSDQELMGFYKTRQSWEGLGNPPWFLSGKRLELVKKTKTAKG